MIRCFCALFLLALVLATQLGGCEDYGDGDKPAAYAASPFVASSNPPSGTGGLATSVSVTLVFSEPMTDATINDTNITLEETVGGAPVTAAVTYTPATLSALVDPTTALLPSTSYTVTVGLGIRDAVGQAPDAPMTVVFTTGAAPDTTPPTFAGASGATPENAVAITVSWSAASDNADAPANLVYWIYMAATTGGQNFGAAPAAVSQAGALSHTVAGLTASTPYFFVVRARDLSGNMETNTTEVTATTPAGRSYLNDVWTPILSVRCTPCHGAGAGGLVMPSASGAYTNMVNVTANACAPLKRVEPFSSAQSVVYLKISGTSCGERMPQGGPYLSLAELDTIRDWIDEGALNN